MIALLLALTCCAPWHRTDAILLTTSSISLALDWSTSRDGVRKGYTETNLLLGKHPSIASTDRYNMSALVVNVIVAELLPRNTRNIYLAFITGLESAFVWNHLQIGLRL